MNRVHPLSEEEVSALVRLHRETKDADVRSRCDMILLSNEDVSPPQIAQRVRFSRSTVVRYIQRYEAEGVDGLFTKPRSGRPRRVTSEYEAKLLEAVKQGQHPGAGLARVAAQSRWAWGVQLLSPVVYPMAPLLLGWFSYSQFSGPLNSKWAV